NHRHRRQHLRGQRHRREPERARVRSGAERELPGRQLRRHDHGHDHLLRIADVPYPRYPTLAALLAATLLAFAGSAGATGLQVSPTSLSLGEARAADGIWFSNTGRDRLHAQVRVYAWSQTGGKDLLEPSR